LLLETDCDQRILPYEFPEQCQQALISDALTNSLHKQAVIYGIEVAGKITFNHLVAGIPACMLLIS